MAALLGDLDDWIPGMPEDCRPPLCSCAFYSQPSNLKNLPLSVATSSHRTLGCFGLKYFFGRLPPLLGTIACGSIRTSYCAIAFPASLYNAPIALVKSLGLINFLAIFRSAHVDVPTTDLRSKTCQNLAW